MRPDLVPGNPFPDLALPDHTGTARTLSELGQAKPVVLAFVRGWWCPKEQVRLRNLWGNPTPEELRLRLRKPPADARFVKHHMTTPPLAKTL
jgi:peroxiredoxin